MPILFKAIKRLQWKYKLALAYGHCHHMGWVTHRVSSLSALSSPVWICKKVEYYGKKGHLYGLESTTSALILSILGLWGSGLGASSTAHCFCLHFINSFSSSLTRSLSSSIVAIDEIGVNKMYVNLENSIDDNLPGRLNPHRKYTSSEETSAVWMFPTLKNVRVEKEYQDLERFL